MTCKTVDPVTKKLKVSKSVLIATGIASFLSAFVPAFLAPPKKSLFSYIDFFGQLICHSMQSYVGIMTAFQFLNHLQCCGTQAKSAAQKEKLKLIQSIEVLLNTYSIESKSFDTSRFKEGPIISPQRMARIIIQQASALQLSSPVSKIGLQKCVYSLAQGLSFIAQIISLVGYLNNTVNGFSLVMRKSFAFGLATAAIFPIILVSIQVSWDSIKKLFLINLHNPLKSLPYEIRKTPYFSGACLLINSTLALFSFSPTLSLLVNAIYTSSEERPSQFAWMDADEKLKIFYTILGCSGTVFFNAFPLPDVQTLLSRYFYLLTAKAKEAAEYRERIGFITTLETVKAYIEESPPDFISDLDLEEDTEFFMHGINTNIIKPRVSYCQKLMSWFCPPKKTTISNPNVSALLF